jgi:lysine-N-methylase
MEGAAAGLLDPAAREAALHPGEGAKDSLASEAFYVRAVIHGHHLVEDALADDEGEEAAPSASSHPPLAVALRDRAARLLIARAMPEAVRRLDAEEPDLEADPAAAYPLALVEAMLRGHGLESYRGEVEGI